MEPLQGTICYIGETQQVSDKFRKREFAIEVPDGQYTQYPKFEATQDKCDLLDKFTEGQPVQVSYNIRGNRYTGKDGKTGYFTSLQAWRIESSTQGGETSVAGTQNAQNAYPAYGEPSDLPF